jgi:enoyl-CoA hydratase/carnithine racemase
VTGAAGSARAAAKTDPQRGDTSGPAAARTTNAAGEPLVVDHTGDDGVCLITLNRPERANAWIDEMELQYFATLRRAARDQDVHAIVIAGAGHRFCPGMDLDRLTEITQGARPYLNDRSPQTLLRDIPKPVIAAVAGPCAGIGFVQAVMADIRFSTPDATWSAAFSRIGLIAEDAVAWRLQRLCGDGVAADLLLSSRPVKGTEAVQIGLANRLVAEPDLISAACTYAAELAERSALSLALIKRQLVLDASSSIGEARQRSVTWLAHAKTQPDYAEGVQALVERRRPRFPALPQDHRDPSP